MVLWHWDRQSGTGIEAGVRYGGLESERFESWNLHRGGRGVLVGRRVWSLRREVRGMVALTPLTWDWEVKEKIRAANEVLEEYNRWTLGQ